MAFLNTSDIISNIYLGKNVYINCFMLVFVLFMFYKMDLVEVREEVQTTASNLFTAILESLKILCAIFIWIFFLEMYRIFSNFMSFIYDCVMDVFTFLVMLGLTLIFSVNVVMFYIISLVIIIFFILARK